MQADHSPEQSVDVDASGLSAGSDPDIENNNPTAAAAKMAAVATMKRHLDRRGFVASWASRDLPRLGVCSSISSVTSSAVTAEGAVKAPAASASVATCLRWSAAAVEDVHSATGLLGPFCRTVAMDTVPMDLTYSIMPTAASSLSIPFEPRFRA